MTETNIWNQDWLWQNSQRNYPLMDGQSNSDDTGTFTIPDSFMLDMLLSVDAFNAATPQEYYIGTIASYPGGLVVTIYRDGNPLGVFTVVSASHTWGKTYQVISSSTSSEELGRIEGWVAIGDLTDILQQPAGAWSFDGTTAMIQPRCVVPSMPGLTGIRVRNSGGLSAILQEIVLFEAGNNTRLRVDGNTVYIDAVGDSDFTADCVCTGTRDLGEPIRSINNVGPGPDGNFTLQPARDCLTLEPTTNGLLMTNTCASPCCGCQQLDIINSALQTLRDQYATLAAVAERVETTAMNLQAVISASPLAG